MLVSRVVRALPIALATSVLLVGLAACGSDDEVDDAADDAVSEPCGLLGDADVERLTDVEVTHEESTDLGLRRCEFVGVEDGEVLLNIIVESSRSSAQELSEETGVADDATVTPVQVPGTTEALFVTETFSVSGIDVETSVLYATTGTTGYTFYGTGDDSIDEQRTSIALLALLLGEEPPAA